MLSSMPFRGDFLNELVKVNWSPAVTKQPRACFDKPDSYNKVFWTVSTPFFALYASTNGTIENPIMRVLKCNFQELSKACIYGFR